MLICAKALLMYIVYIQYVDVVLMRSSETYRNEISVMM